MSQREIKNATVKSTRLGFDRGVFLCGWLTLDYGGAGQGFGGYMLGSKSSDEGPKGYAETWLVRILDVLDVEKWEDLPGTPCRVDAEHGRVHGIGHYLKEEWFYPEKEFDAIRQNDDQPPQSG